MSFRRSSTRGFKRTGSVLNEQIRKAGETRGFAVSKLLTHWEETVGADIAAVARPVNIGYGRGSFGATLTVLTTGAQAPMLEMQKEQLRSRVNAVYGYNAISKIRITQTAPTGFAEGQAVFQHARAEQKPKPADPEVQNEATHVAEGAQDSELRAALENLARNFLTKQKSQGKG